MPVRDQLIDQILDHLRLIGAEVDVLNGAASGFLRLNRTDLRAIQVLRGGGGLTAGALARALRITSGATTRVIDRLVTGGHARRAADPDDRRRVLVRLTADAERTFDRSFERFREQAMSLLQAYSDEELHTVERFLTEVRSLVRAHARRLRNPPPPLAGGG